MSAKQRRYSLDVDPLRADMGRRAAHGSALVIGAEVTKLVLSVGSTALLARLLVPEAFGLVAMVVALTGLAGIFTDLGLSAAVIQRRDVTEAQVNALFWINAAAGAVLAIALAGLAQVIAWFYDEPRLGPIAAAVASVCALAGLGVQHRALLQRQMRFRALVFIELSAAVGGIAVALLLALRGFGYWALVANAVAAAALTTAFSWALCAWRPRFPSRAQGLSSLLAFGGHLTGFAIVNYFARNLDNVLIGWWWGPTAVALYDRAYKVLLLPIQNINTPVWRVMAPALSHIHDDGRKWARAYCRSATAVLLIGAPLSTFCFVFADVVIPLVLGPQWTDAVQIFRYLAISGMAQCLCNTVGWIFISSGRTDRMFRWGLVSSSAVCASFLVGLPFGATGVALAYSITSVSLAVPCVVYGCRTTPLRPMQVFAAALPAITASILAGACAYATRRFAGAVSAEGLALSFGVFLVTYLAFVLPWRGPRDTIAFAVQKFAAAR